MKYDITLKRGERELPLSVSEDALDDWELLDDIATADDPEASATAKLRATGHVFTRLLGAEQFQALKDLLRTEDGRVPVTAMNAALTELFEEIGKAKKS